MLAHKLAEEEYDVLPQQIKTHEDYLNNQENRRRAVRRSNLRGKAVILLLLITAVAGIITFEASVIASKGIEIVNIRTEAAKLELENSQLKISNAQMKSPQRIKAIDQQRLGMTVADQVYFAEGK